VTAAPIVLAGLIALVAPGAPGGTGRLEHVAPATLEPLGRGVTVPDSSLGFSWAIRGSTLAFVVKPVATGQPIRIADVRTLRSHRLIRVGDRDVCGLTFDRGDLVALTANQPCYWAKGRFSLVRYDTSTWRAKNTLSLPVVRSVFPTNLAFGDGSAFVARAGAGVDVIDLRTGAVVRRHPRRSLAKGEGIVFTRWLGSHLLAMGPTVVDVRTWRSRVLDPAARGVAPAGADLVTYGARGVQVFTRAGRLRYRLFTGTDIAVVRVVGPFLYAAEGKSILGHVIDLRTRRETFSSADASLVWSLLVP
jgi:hypothetical protein